MNPKCNAIIEDVVNDYGMRAVLEALIEFNQYKLKYDELYIQKIIIDLKQTLSNYENRYTNIK